jgi:hypothetical protein
VRVISILTAFRCHSGEAIIDIDVLVRERQEVRRLLREGIRP